MKSVLALVLVLFSSTSFAAKYKTANCEQVNFTPGAWQEITRAEPRIYKQLEYIAKHQGYSSNGNVETTNCHVTYPVNGSGTATNGMRTAVIDKVWKASNGIHHVGMKILYSEERIKTVNQAQTQYVYDPNLAAYVQQIVYVPVRTKSREVYGFSVCMADSCEKLGVPYRGEKPASSGPRTYLTVPRIE